MKRYTTILKEHSLNELSYQRDFLHNRLLQNSSKPFVLAAGTSAGKTLTTIIELEMFYSDSSNKNKKTLIVPASKTVLRDNFKTELDKFGPKFSYCVCSNKKQLISALNSKCNVIIALPQTLNNNYQLLPKLHNFILDEAHQWYFKPTLQKVIKHTKPSKQLLLTGTPSRFIAKGDEFEFKFVPIMELYDEGLVSNVKLEVVSSSYDFKQSQYNSNYGNLKSSVRMTRKESEEALMMVCREMIKKLKNPIKGLPTTNRLTKQAFSIFGELDKTIIFCHSLKQADAFFDVLNDFKGLKDKVLISHSENDSDSEYFEEFRNNSNIKVLVAVDRGRLGYNLPELYNVVDFTLTQSLDMLLQMYGRLLRLSKSGKQKIYYKVATKNTAGYFVDLMTAMLCLTDMKWYSKFNGKNMGGILIPKVLTKSTKSGKKSTQPKNGKKGTPQLKSIEELGIPLDLNLFRQDVLYSQNDKFSTIAWNTLDECRQKFFGIKLHKIDKNKIKKLAEQHKSVTNFAKLYPAEYEIINEKNWNNEMFSKMKDYNNIPNNPKEILQFVKDNNITTKHKLYKTIHAKLMSYDK
jgi:superfamily II DNA or RNA helicase